MQSEISKLLGSLNQFGYPQQLIITHQQTLSPPSDFDLASQTLLNVIRFLLTNSVPVFVSYIKKMNPPIHNDIGLITTFYQALNNLKYIPKVAPEAFLDRFHGSVQNYSDLHTERIRVVRIFSKLLIQLQQKWGNLSSEKLRGNDDFALLLQNGNQQQNPHGFQPPQFGYPPQQRAQQQGQFPQQQQQQFGQYPIQQHYPVQQQLYQPYVPVQQNLMQLTRQAVDANLGKEQKKLLSKQLMIPIDLIPEDIQERLRKQFQKQDESKQKGSKKVQQQSKKVSQKAKKSKKQIESDSSEGSESEEIVYKKGVNKNGHKTKKHAKYSSDESSESTSSDSESDYQPRRKQKQQQKQMSSSDETSSSEEEQSKRSKKQKDQKSKKNVKKHQKYDESSDEEQNIKNKKKPKQLYKQDKDLDKYIDDKYKNQYSDRKESELQNRYQTALDQTPDDLTLQSKSVPESNISNILNATYEKDPELVRTQRINDLINKSQVGNVADADDIINKYLGPDPKTITPDQIDKHIGIVGKSVTIDDEPSVIIGDKMYNYVEPPSNITNQNPSFQPVQNQFPSYNTNTLLNQPTYPNNIQNQPVQLPDNNFQQPQSVSDYQPPVNNQFQDYLNQQPLPSVQQDIPLNIYTENTPYPPVNDFNNNNNMNAIPIPDMFNNNQDIQNKSQTPYDVTNYQTASQIPANNKDFFATASLISQAQTGGIPINSAYQSVPEENYKDYNIQIVSPPRLNNEYTLPATQQIYPQTQTPQVRTEEVLHVLQTEDAPHNRESSQISKVDNIPPKVNQYVSSSQSNSSNQPKLDIIDPSQQLFNNSIHESAPQTDQFGQLYQINQQQNQQPVSNNNTVQHITDQVSQNQDFNFQPEPSINQNGQQDYSQPQPILKNHSISNKNIFDTKNENFDEIPQNNSQFSSSSSKKVSFDQSQLPDPTTSSSSDKNIIQTQNQFVPTYPEKDLSALISDNNKSNSLQKPSSSQNSNIYLPSSDPQEISSKNASTSAALPEVSFKKNFPIYKVENDENLPQIDLVQTSSNSMKSADLATSHLPQPESSSSYNEIVKTIAESLTSSARILNEINTHPADLSTLRIAQSDRNSLLNTEKQLRSRVSFTDNSSSFSVRQNRMKSELEELKKSEILLQKSKSQRQKIENSEVSNTARLQALLQKGKSLLKDMSEIGSIQFSETSDRLGRERSVSKRSSLQSSIK